MDWALDRFEVEPLNLLPVRIQRSTMRFYEDPVIPGLGAILFGKPCNVHHLAPLHPRVEDTLRRRVHSSCNDFPSEGLPQVVLFVT